jgi:DNA-binding NarL/FixJ family response regulator
VKRPLRHLIEYVLDYDVSLEYVDALKETSLREQRPATRILIADDHQLMADACKNLLEPEFLVVGIVTDGRDLVNATAEFKLDIILLDIYMPRLNGLDAGEQIKKTNPRIKLVFLTMTMEAEMAAEAFRRGASGYVWSARSFVPVGLLV